MLGQVNVWSNCLVGDGRILKWVVTLAATLLVPVWAVFGQAKSSIISADAPPMRLVADSGIDLNGDGYFERLSVTVEVDIPTAGAFTMLGRLCSSDGVRICRRESMLTGRFTSTRLECVPGKTEFRLAFGGEEIYRAGTDGPFLLEVDLIGLIGADTVIMDKSFEISTGYDHERFREITSQPTGVSDGDIDSGSYGRPDTAASYDRESFRRTIGRIAGIADSTIDTDGDGLFDTLAIVVSVETIDTGIYVISAQLTSPGGSPDVVYGTASVTDTLVPGVNAIRFGIGGNELVTRRHFGPYRVTVELTRGGHRYDSMDFSTKNYGHIDFDYDMNFFCAKPVDLKVDNNGDGSYEALRFDIPVCVLHAGGYKICGRLEWKDGTLVSEHAEIMDLGIVLMGGRRPLNCVEEFLEPGTDTVHLTFNGMDIRDSGLDGPYVLKVKLDVLREPYSGKSPAEGYYLPRSIHDEAVFKTLPYRHIDFSSPARVVGYEDRKVDLDGDGLAEYLQADITIEGEEHGTYDYHLQMPGDKGSYRITSVRDSIILSGDREVETVKITGQEIQRRNSDGPRRMRFDLFKDGRRNDSTTLQTSPLVRSEFSERIPHFVRLSADSGIDKNGDGLYDVLAVSIEAHIGTAGRYGVCGRLMSEDGKMISGWSSIQRRYTSCMAFLWDENCVGLDCDTGMVTFDMEFSGQQIYESEVDGAYHLVLKMGGSGFAGTIDTVTFVTSQYKNTDFGELPLIVEVAPFAYDKTGDNVYDVFEVRIGVEAYDGGRYPVVARLMAGSKVVSEAHGAITVPRDSWSSPHRTILTFDPDDIIDSELDGPFEVMVEVSSPGGRATARKSVVTDPYKYTEFVERK